MQACRRPRLHHLTGQRVPAWVHGAGSGPSGRISQQFCFYGFLPVNIAGRRDDQHHGLPPQSLCCTGVCLVWLCLTACFGDWQSSPYQWYLPLPGQRGLSHTEHPPILLT